MHRNGITARCALLARRRAWEVRVIVDDATLLAERSRRLNDAFDLAACWKSRLLEQRWTQSLPASPADEGLVTATRIASATRRTVAGGRSWKKHVPAGE
jgi:hypothetical protein